MEFVLTRVSEISSIWPFGPEVPSSTSCGLPSSTLCVQDSAGPLKSCVSYSSTLELKTNCFEGRELEEDDDCISANLSVGIHRCPEGALVKGMRV